MEFTGLKWDHLQKRDKKECHSKFDVTYENGGAVLNKMYSHLTLD